MIITALFSVGGETIRGIIKACGAHVELNRMIPESSPTKCFIIRGIEGWQFKMYSGTPKNKV